MPYGRTEDRAGLRGRRATSSADYTLLYRNKFKNEEIWKGNGKL